jgi:hypothetical protein
MAEFSHILPIKKFVKKSRLFNQVQKDHKLLIQTGSQGQAAFAVRSEPDVVDHRTRRFCFFDYHRRHRIEETYFL